MYRWNGDVVARSGDRATVGLLIRYAMIGISTLSLSQYLIPWTASISHAPPSASKKAMAGFSAFSFSRMMNGDAGYSTSGNVLYGWRSTGVGIVCQSTSLIPCLTTTCCVTPSSLEVRTSSLLMLPKS